MQFQTFQPVHHHYSRFSYLASILIVLFTTTLIAQEPKLSLEGNLTMVNFVDDGFEDGTLSPFTSGGAGFWWVQSTHKSEGLYAAKSGPISDNQVTYIDLNVFISEASTLFFYLKVSSEPNYDELIFTLDGVNELVLSGDHPWMEYAYEIDAGSHSMRWSYYKDGSNTAGLDAAFLDDVRIGYASGQLFQMQDGTEGEGKVLTSNDDGKAIWEKLEKTLSNTLSEPILLRGSFNPNPYVYRERKGAPLILENDHPQGCGLRITRSSTAICIDSAAYGLSIDYSEWDGISVAESGLMGVRSLKSKLNDFFSFKPTYNGYYADSSGLHGFYARAPDSSGVVIDYAGRHGMEIMSPNEAGIRITQPVLNGIEIESSGSIGMRIDSAGADALIITAAGINGLAIYNPAMDGIQINYPVDDGIEVVHGGSDGISKYAAHFTGHLFTTHIAKSGGSFQIDHPLDPENKYLFHSFVESPDMMNVYNGNVILDENGEAVVELEDWFEALNKEFRYQLTCIGGFAQVYIKEEIMDNRFTIAGGKSGLKVSWQVSGIRKDPYANANRIKVEVEKPEEYKGHYLNAEAWALEKGVGELPSITDARQIIKEDKK